MDKTTVNFEAQKVWGHNVTMTALTGHDTSIPLPQRSLECACTCTTKGPHINRAVKRSPSFCDTPWPRAVAGTSVTSDYWQGNTTAPVLNIGLSITQKDGRIRDRCNTLHWTATNPSIAPARMAYVPQTSSHVPPAWNISMHDTTMQGGWL